MKKRLVLTFAVISIVSASVAAYYRTNRADAGPQLVTAAVTRGDVVETVQATGTLQAVTTVQVGTQVSGTIQALKADFNSEVRRGQVIAELDPSLFQTQVDQAQATVVRLQSDVERAKVELGDAEVKLRRAADLKAKQLIPEVDYETAQATTNSARAAVKSAEAQVTQAIASLKQSQVNLAHTVITAPIDGIVLSRDVDVGQTVAASMQAPTLFVIARDLTQMQVSASIDESDIGRIANGQPVAFRVDAYPSETFTGTVSQVRLQPVVDQNVVSYATVIDVPNPDLKLKPGMTATVTVEVARSDNAFRVPSAALSFRPMAEVLAAYGGGQDAPTPSSEGRVRLARNQQPFDSAQGKPFDFAQGKPFDSAQGNPFDSAQGKQRASARRDAVWVLADGRMKRVPVQVGVSDGATTAIVGSELTEDAAVVTGMASATAGASQSAGSPLLPFAGRRPAGGQRTGAGR